VFFCQSVDSVLFFWYELGDKGSRDDINRKVYLWYIEYGSIFDRSPARKLSINLRMKTLLLNGSRVQRPVGKDEKLFYFRYPVMYIRWHVPVMKIKDVRLSINLIKCSINYNFPNLPQVPHITIEKYCLFFSVC
jgi:hypothetical protein